jgi:hypothetical protein
MCQDARLAERHVRLILAQTSKVGRRAFRCSESCCNAGRLEIVWLAELLTQDAKGDAYSAWSQLAQFDQKIVHFGGIGLNKLGRDRQGREDQRCNFRQSHIGVSGLATVSDNCQRADAVSANGVPTAKHRGLSGLGHKTVL